MTTISSFQLNAFLRAGLVAASATISSLGYMGGNVESTTDSTFAYLHNNAVLDTRGFTALGTGSTSTTLDANGLPTGASTLCLSTPPSASAPGPLPPGNYYLNVYSVGQTVTASMFAACGMTLGTGVPQGDGVCIRYPVTIALGSSATQAVNFSGAMSQIPDLARDGSVTAVGQPTFYAVALAHLANFGTLRWMDFLITNTRTDVAWTDRPGNFPLRAYGTPHSWEKWVALTNAVAAYPGSKLQNVLINIPPSADDTYCPGLSAYLNTLGLTSTVKVYPQYSNEHWNNRFGVIYNLCINSAITDLTYLANYGTGSPAISDVTTNGTIATFTTASPIGSYLTTTANCIVVGDVGGFNVGSVASPVVATKTGSNTFTVPTSSNIGTGDGTNGDGRIGVIFNLASTLLGDGAAPTVYGTNGANNKWYIRRVYQMQQQWAANRPQDRWFFETSLYGGQGAGGNSSTPNEYKYAAYLGGGSASSWLYGAAVGWYVTAASNSTATAVFADLNTKLNSVSEGEIRGHVYQCKKYGLHPMAYEAGPDIQLVPALQSAVSTDSRMQTFITAMLDKWFSNGGEIFSYFGVSPAAFVDGNAQGGWSALQSYADTTSPKFAALVAYLPSTITLSNINSGGVIDVAGHFQLTDSRGQAHNGLVGWFDTPPNFVDCLVPIPQAGSYTFTIEGCAASTSTIDVYVDSTNSGNGTSIGTSTMPIAGGGWFAGSSTDALPVSNPVTVSLTAGMHILRMTNPSRTGNGGVGIKDVTYVLN